VGGMTLIGIGIDRVVVIAECCRGVGGSKKSTLVDQRVDHPLFTYVYSGRLDVAQEGNSARRAPQIIRCS
jgi:hypothetical protein